ncbi:MAG: hypothetical protein Unbinned5081contig1002_5 [Prokaryotic dsDNA virus sp.]|nr:MAG: hypothetical protein Unbinned5081contig1002_5 [Prokaryotic dsDNA virus sp.]|tara:strand:+ start:6042 stop:6236 length:195 start_codon:yes stop_codon:yes gene_type:complete
MNSLYDFQRQQDKEMKEWSSSTYTGDKCTNCGRVRVQVCENGKHWCEKCKWVEQDECYFNPEWG